MPEDFTDPTGSPQFQPPSEATGGAASSGRARGHVWVSRRTLVTIYNRLRSLATDNRLQRSVKALAAEIGYSPATTHRALELLEQEGKIVRFKTAPNLPDIIEFTDLTVIDDVKAKVQRSRAGLEQAHDDLVDAMKELLDQNELLSKQAQEYRDLMDRVISDTTDPVTGTRYITCRPKP